jgi:hypothetical protein
MSVGFDILVSSLKLKELRTIGYKQGKDYDVVSKKILDSKLGRNKKGSKKEKPW